MEPNPEPKAEEAKTTEEPKPVETAPQQESKTNEEEKKPEETAQPKAEPPKEETKAPNVEKTVEPPKTEEKKEEEKPKKITLDTPDNRTKSINFFCFIYIVTSDIEKTFSVLNKFDTQRDKLFWEEIEKIKPPLGNVLEESMNN